MQSDSSELLELSDQLVMRADAPFLVSVYDLHELIRVAEDALRGVEQAASARQIVLEAWLLVDYAVRSLLGAAFDLSSYSTDDYDLRYELLPNSFRRCLDLLERLHQVHLAVPEDPDINRVRLPAEFLMFLAKERRDDFLRLIELEQEFYRARHPELATPAESRLGVVNISLRPEPLVRRTRRLRKPWMDVVERLGNNWFRGANQLNKARNVAAHDTNAERITAAFGHTGPQAVELTRAACIDIIQKLLGLARTQSSAAGSDAGALSNEPAGT